MHMDKLIRMEAQPEAETFGQLPKDAVHITGEKKLALIYAVFPQWSAYSHFYVHAKSHTVWGVRAFEPKDASPVYRLL